ncbi:MAG: efflux RND transporter periplasmic adaptor subunit, partial [Nitrospinales bacterium]
MKKIEDDKIPYPFDDMPEDPSLDKDSSLDKEAEGPSSDEEEEEEILFPFGDEESEPPPPPPPRRRFSLFKLVLWTLALGAIFFLGYYTQPEQLSKVKGEVEKYASLAREKAVPAQEKVTEFIESKLDQASGKPAANQTTPGTAGKPQKKIKYWQGPMNPSYISDKPGKSPMGMDLIPVYEEEGDDVEGIRISPTVVQNIGVKTEILKRRTLAREIRTVGRLTYDERLVTHIHTKFEGWIEKLHVDFTGQEVKKDELLVEIYSPELVSTQEELLLALKYHESLKNSAFADIAQGAKDLFTSTRERLELFDIPEHQIDELIKNRKITKTMHIHSPVVGFVIKKKALQGMYVKPGMSLYTIADLSNIWVLADIYEYELPWIKIGQPAEMDLAYFPGKKFKGKITFIDPFLEPKTRTIKVRMEFENPDWDLKPDMYANVFLKSVIEKSSVAVPEEAVIRSGEKNIVLVLNEGGGFESREVILGVQAGNYIQVIKGLKDGE